MMKRLFILSLALVLVFTLASAGLARINLDSDSVEVRAIVHPYAEIRDLNDPNNPLLHYVGYAGEEHTWQDYFFVVANTDIGMQLNQVDFTHKTKGDTFYTRAKIQRAARYGDDRGDQILRTDSFRPADARNYVQGQDGKWYLLDVKGKLGEVYSQAAGQYKAKFIVTVFTW
ncbi:MAG TPA: hypothetical protein GXZ26_07710 [Firmicutes bacterium]|mgnify:CR=1 FL=1|jgi:hypothetical protein|nr:hypothetical protein [Bacillota bacterium]